MDLIMLVFGLVLLGAALEFIKTRFAIDATVLWVIRAVIIIAMILLLVRLFGKYIPNVM